MSRSFKRLRIAHKALPKTDLTKMPKVGQIVDCDLSSSLMEASDHRQLIIRHSNLKNVNPKKSRLISAKVIHSNLGEAKWTTPRFKTPHSIRQTYAKRTLSVLH